MLLQSREEEASGSRNSNVDAQTMSPSQIWIFLDLQNTISQQIIIFFNKSKNSVYQSK